MREKTVAFVSRSCYLHHIGGMETIAWDIAQSLVDRDLRVIYLTTHIPGCPAQFNQDGIEVIALANTTPGVYSSGWWKESKTFIDENLAVTTNNVFSVSAGAFSALSLKKKHPHIKFIIQIHGASLDEIKSKWRTKQVLKILSSGKNLLSIPQELRYYGKFDYIVAVGGKVYGSLKTPPLCWVISPNKLRLINNGVDISVFSPNKTIGLNIRRKLNLTSQHKLVVSASRLDYQKGFNYALQGFAQYARKEREARYLIIGDGPEKKSLEKLANEYGVENQVLFLGSVERSKLPDLLRAGDIFLLTTLAEEGLPMSLLEALAVGLPVLTSSHMSQNLNFSPHISFVNPKDVRGIEFGIDKLIKSSHGANRLSNLLPQEFHLDHCVNGYLELLS